MARFVSSGASAGTTAASITYDNATSGLSAVNAKAALDELEAEKQPINSGKSAAHALGTVSSGTTTPEPSAGAVNAHQWRRVHMGRAKRGRWLYVHRH